MALAIGDNKYAGFWSRTLAIIVDGIILVVVGMAASFLASFASWGAAITNNSVCPVFSLLDFTNRNLWADDWQMGGWD